MPLAAADSEVQASLLMRPRIITLKDGKEVRCVVIAAGWRGYLVVVDGEETFLPVDSVASVKDAPGVDETSLNVKAFAVGVRDGSFVLTSQEAYLAEDGEDEPRKEKKPRPRKQKKTKKEKKTGKRPNRPRPRQNKKKETTPVYDKSRVIDLTDGTTTELSKKTVRGGYASGNGNKTPPTVISETTTYRVIGRAITYQISGTNAPSSYSASNLPEGLTLNKQTGVISGTLNEAKTHTFIVRALNGDGTGTAEVTLVMGINTGSPGTITRDPATAWKARFTGAAGVSRYSATDLPDGITFDANTGQYRSSGLTAGTYTFEATAHYPSGTGVETLGVVVETLTEEADPPSVVVVDDVKLGTVFTLPDAGAVTDPVVTIEGDGVTANWLLTVSGAGSDQLTLQANTAAGLGAYTNNSHFNYDTRLECKVGAVDKVYYLNVIPARSVSLDVSKHELLVTPKDMDAKFDAAALLVSADHDGVRLVQDSKTTAADMHGVEGRDDVDMDLTFTITPVADFPNQSEDTAKDESERYDYTHPSYLVVWDTATLYQLRAGTFSSIKQVEGVSIGGLVLDGFSKFGGNSMVLVNDCQETTTVHEWMHNCKIYHRSDRPQGVAVTPQAGMPYFDPLDSAAPYLISYGDSATVNEINRSERTRMLDWDPNWTGDEGDTAMLAQARIVGWPEAAPLLATANPVVGKPVVLSGLGSRSLSGSIRAYNWRQTAGPSVSLIPEDAAATFVPQKPGTYVFELTVVAPSGLSSGSQPSALTVNVSP